MIRRRFRAFRHSGRTAAPLRAFLQTAGPVGLCAATANRPTIVRERPGDGHRHILRKRDVARFLTLLPSWAELSDGLDAIVLAKGDEEYDGWHVPGSVAVCAWERMLWRTVNAEFYRENADIFARMGIPCDKRGSRYLCRFTEGGVRAYQLVHVLLHELGHHHDRVTTKSKQNASRGERYADRFAREHSELIWDRYLEAFGMD